MNRFLYTVFVLVSCVMTNCWVEGHRAYTGFKLYNNSGLEVQLVPEGPEVKSLQLENESVTFPGHILIERTLDYEGLDNPEETEEMARFNVIAGGATVGYVKFFKTSRPDPRVKFETEEDSGFKLRQKFSRFGGGGPTAIEVVRTSDR